MLYQQTVSPKLLEILTALMSNPYFGEFYLVGGTSLALQIGHRESVDIDLFGHKELEELEVSDFLSNLGKVQILKRSRNILIYTIDGIKVDLVNYRHPWLYPSLNLENLRLADQRDIAAMKLNAISGRGSKKDFIDLHFLLNKYSLSDMIGYYNKKFIDGSEFLVLKSLTYFEDADLDETPKMLFPIEWEEVKRAILREVKNYLNSL
jgi:hypothetical protein